MNGINFVQAANTAKREGLRKLDANAGDGYIKKIMGGFKEITDEMFGGSDLYEKLTSFTPGEAKQQTHDLLLGTEAGQKQLQTYHEQLTKQQDVMKKKMEKYDPATLGSTSESAQKSYDRYFAQHEELGSELARIEKGRIDFAAKAEGSEKFGIKVDPGSGAKFKNLGTNIKDYYTEGDGATLAARAGVTAGAYGVGAVGLRYMGGGTLGTNASGGSDIAGIPFI